jgi:hypothetical protein
MGNSHHRSRFSVTPVLRPGYRLLLVQVRPERRRSPEQGHGEREILGKGVMHLQEPAR